MMSRIPMLQPNYFQTPSLLILSPIHLDTNANFWNDEYENYSHAFAYIAYKKCFFTRTYLKKYIVVTPFIQKKKSCQKVYMYEEYIYSKKKVLLNSGTRFQTMTLNGVRVDFFSF